MGTPHKEFKIFIKRNVSFKFSHSSTDLQSMALTSTIPHAMSGINCLIFPLPTLLNGIHHETKKNTLLILYQQAMYALQPQSDNHLYLHY